MNSCAYYLGATVGILIGLAFVLILVRIMHKDKIIETIYDERQNSIRGIAYKYSFFTVIIGNGIYTFKANEINKFFKPEAVAYIIIALGILVYAGYCIYNEAYLGMNENRGKVIIGFLIISVANLVPGFTNYANGKIFENGRVGLSSVNFVCGLLMLIIVFMIVVKMIINKKEVE